MENLEQLQLVVGEVQAARQQVSSVRAQVQELEGTITAVQNQPGSSCAPSATRWRLG